MNFVFTQRFYLLIAIGLIPLSLSWQLVELRAVILIYDLLILALAFVDARLSTLPSGLIISREFDSRFSLKDSSTVTVTAQNESESELKIALKDEYPPEMLLSGSRESQFQLRAYESKSFSYKLTPTRRGAFEFGRIAVRYLSRMGLVWKQTSLGLTDSVKVYPSMRRAREMEIKVTGARSVITSQRRTRWRGEGREFESLRDYVPGDELRHVSWTATARKGRLVTRQYQIERDQTIVIAIDAGRLMTSRIEDESKLDIAINAALALMSAALRGGDNVATVIFARTVLSFIPPSRGQEHLQSTLEALHNVEPEMIESSYSRAFEFIYSRCKRRALVAILTDLVDEQGSSELLRSVDILRPRHLPLVVTIADRDLQSALMQKPKSVRELFVHSVAEEIVYQRESALKVIESRGGLTIDVTAAGLAPALLETYIKVKQRALL
jgi:uncharacterized protein (DUF58 family)